MGANVPRRHHTVPRAYLLAFAHGKVVGFRRRDGAAGRASARRLAVESNFYSLGGAQPREEFLENWLSEYVDGPGEGALAAARRDGLPLTPDHQNALALTVAFQVARTRSFRFVQQQITQHVGPLLWAQAVVEKLTKGLHVTFDERADLIREHYYRAPAEVRRVDDSRSLHRSMVRYADQLAHELLSWHWSILGTDQDRLVTSDNPLVVLDTDPAPGWRGVVPPHADIHLPLSPRSLLLLTRSPSLGGPGLLTAELVDATNRAQARQATQAVFHHPDMPWPDELTLAPDPPSLPIPRITLRPAGTDGAPTFPARFPQPYRDSIASLLRELGGIDEVR